eukprot:11457458-Alexandrium_andersonii.AAC.1
MVPHQATKAEEASQTKEDLGEKSRSPKGSASQAASAALDAATHAAAYGAEQDDPDHGDDIVPEQQ